MLKLSPQQIQLIKLLQLPTDMLEQRIKEELEGNPALEEGSPDADGLGIEDELPTLVDVSDDNTDAPPSANTPTDESETDESSDEEFDLNNENTLDAETADMTEFMDEGEAAEYRMDNSVLAEEQTRKDVQVAADRSLHDYLEEQLGLEELDEQKYLLGLFLIGSLDDDGYLRRPLDSLADDLALSQNIHTTVEELAQVLKIIQRFDPPGIGAHDLRECLLLQLQREPDTHPLKLLCTKIIQDHFEEFVKKHYDKLQRLLHVDEDTLRQAIQHIIHLNPKPGSAFTGSYEYQKIIVPDFHITNNDGELELTLNSMNVPELRISKQFREMLLEYQRMPPGDKARREALLFIKQKINGAKWFIDAIKQRQQTLLLTMNAIMQHQNEFFLTGDESKLKPMILKDIAQKTGLDISTVSRVANSKYVQTEFGTYRLKYFFSESLTTDKGEEVSTREVKKILSDLIALEDKNKPLSDEKLTELLKQKGYNIARRTVAKYREQMEIPVARLRKAL